MAPIKFEENIKDKLERRTLKPSIGGWETLSDKLDAEPKKKNGTYWWLGVAASFVGLLIVSSIFFSKSSGDSNNTLEIVNEDIENPVKKEDAVLNQVIEEQSVQDNQVALGEIKKQDEILKKEFIPTNQVVVKTQVDEVLLVEENTIKEETIDVFSHQETSIATNVTSVKTFEDKKVEEVVAHILKLQEEKPSVTDAEIDALLGQAQKELTSQRLYDASTRTVSAEQLLIQVETDLEDSFRDRVFDALKSGYKKVKTAVAERNN